jgi:hypothetical protein
VTPRLMSRFSGTHSIEFVSARERNPADYPLPMVFRLQVQSWRSMKIEALPAMESLRPGRS